MERLTRQKGPDGKELTPCSLCYMADLPICKKNSGECWELAMYERLTAYEDTGHEPRGNPGSHPGGRKSQRAQYRPHHGRGYRWSHERYHRQVLHTAREQYAMNCYGCKCNYCLYNCELESWYLTPGEVGNVEDICYFCDECRGFDGDYRKRSNYRTECSRQRFPKKYLAQEELIAPAAPAAPRRYKVCKKLWKC